MSDGTLDAGTSAEGDSNREGQADAKTFTQDEVNSLLAKQKREVRSQFADYDTFKTKANELSQQKDSLIEERDSFKDERDSARLEAIRLKVAFEKGLPSDLFDRLRGQTEEELEADADELLKFVKPRNSGFDGGVRQDPPKEESADGWFFKYMTDQQ